MRKITVGTVPHTTEDTFEKAEPYNLNASPPKPARARLRLRHLRLLLISACAIAATACASLRGANEADSTIAAAEAAANEAKADAAAAAAARAEAEAAAAAALKDAEMARADAAAAMKDAEMARADAAAAMKDAEMARADAAAAMEGAEMARADADAASEKLMVAMAPHTAEVMVSIDQFDPALLSMDDAEASLAGPDSIYVSSIMYDGQPYSALLEYSGGTTATVESIFGARGKLIPDSVDLSRTRLFFKAPDKLTISNVAVGSAGYSGELRYVGGNRLQVTGLGRVILPPTPDEQIESLRRELAAAEAKLLEADIAAGDARAEAEASMADAATARAEAETSMADADAARAERDAAMLARSVAEIRAEDAEVAQWVAETDAAAARAELDAMVADAIQPSAIMIGDDQIDPSRASFADARMAVAGPDSVYVSSILYDGQRYSALLRYSGGTTAEVSQLFGSRGRLIPDSMDLSQTELVFVSPNAWEVSNVSVGGVGYSGTLAYAGDGTLQVADIRQVELPPTALEEAHAALAQVEAALAAAQADIGMKSEQIASLEANLQAAEDSAADARAEADAAHAATAEAQAMAAEAQAGAEMANADLAAMMAEAFQPSAVMISDAQIDPNLASFADAQVAIAGPDAIYVSNIMYDGQPYSALLKYEGGTTATVQGIFGASGKLIPDSVGLSQTTVGQVSPGTFAVSNVNVSGVGYSGTLQYTGDGQLQVTDIRRVTLPPTDAEKADAAIDAAMVEADRMVSAAQAEAEQMISAAQAEAQQMVSAAQAEAEQMVSAARAEADAAHAATAEAQAMAAEAQAGAEMANADLAAMMAEAFQPSAVMISDAQIDPNLASFADAQVAIAGPDAIYVSNIMYDGQPYSALLKYEGGTTATVQGIFGASGKLIPDSVGLSQTTVGQVSPGTFAVSNVNVSGVGYSGTLQYTGDGQLQVTDIRRVTLPPTDAEKADAAIDAAMVEADRMVSAAQAEAEQMISAAQAEAQQMVSAAQAEAEQMVSAARAEADAAHAATAEAQAMAAEAQAGAEMANADLAAMMAEAFQPSAVMISDAQIDPNLASFADAQVAIAGPDAIYVSNIMYDGQPYSALLKYEGGTTATVQGIFGASGKLIPDSVGLSQTTVGQVSPGTFAVSNVNVSGVGYSGTLQYTGDGQLQVTDIRRVTLPPTDAEKADAAIDAAMVEADRMVSTAQAEAEQMISAAQAEAQQMVSAAQAEADAAHAATAEAQAMAAEAQAGAEMANADLAAMMAEAFQPSAVMISDAQIDPNLASFADAQVAIAGPDAIYVSNIMYDGQPYSALLKYEGGTTATVQGIFGASGKLIPDSVGLSQTTVGQVSPGTFAVSNVNVSGVGYSGTLQYTGDGQLQVTDIRRVTLPPTDAEKADAAIDAAMVEADRMVSAAQAEAEQMISAAQAEAQQMVSAAQAEADAAHAATAEAQAMAAEAQAMAAEAQAGAEMANADLAAMMAEAFQPSAVMISDAQIDPNLASFADAQVAIAGPDAIYVSNIMYDGQPYSALLKYEGGTTATVQGIFGASGKLIPDSVGLSQTTVGQVSPGTFAVSNVNVSGVGYSGTLQYTGDGQLQVTDIRRVTLPPTDAEKADAAIDAAMVEADRMVSAAQAEAEQMISAAQAEADAAHAATAEAQAMAAEAQAGAEMANADLAAMMAEAFQPSAVMISDAQIDPNLADFGKAQASLAGPDEIYVSNIMYDGQPYSALLKYEGGTTATVQGIFGASGKLIPDSVGLSQTTVGQVSPGTFAVSNVNVSGVGYSGTLQYTGDGQLQVTDIRRVTLPPTDAEKADAAIDAAMVEADRMVSAAQAEAQQMVSAAQAEAEQMVSAARAEADAAHAATAEAQAGAEMANADLAAMMDEAFQPSAVMISDAQIDPNLASFADAQVAIAGPDSVYVSSILYDGQRYSALLKYTGGTTAEVEQIFGSSSKMIPDSVDLSQTELVFTSPNAWEVSNVSVGGAGYSGTLAYTGDGQLQVTDIRQVELPPTALEEAQAALARIEEALAEAEADNDALQANIVAKSDQIASLMADLQAAQDALAEAQAAVAEAQAVSDAAQEAAEMASAELDDMKRAMYQPSEVMVSFADLDASLADFGNARASLAGPDAVYVSNIVYAGRPYSALLKYEGGTTATVKQVFGPDGKLIPDSVGLARTAIAFRSPDSFSISNVAVDGNGYSGTLQYTGNGQLQVTGIRRVTLPPTEAEKAAAAIDAAKAEAARMVSEAKAEAEQMISNAQADATRMVSDAKAEAEQMISNAQAAADADVSAAMAEAEAARDELEAIKMAMHQASTVMVSFSDLDTSLVSFESAQASLAGPDSIYISSIMYGGQPYSALIKYEGGTTATVQGIFGASGKLIPDAVGLSQTTVGFVSPDSFAVSNVNVGGVGYSGTLQYTGNGQLQVTGIRRVVLPPTEAENAAAAVEEAMMEADRMVGAARAEAEQMVSAVMAEADAKVSAAMAEADVKVSAAMAEADVKVSAAMARAAAAEEELNAMEMAMHQPSAVQVAFSQLDPHLADFGSAQVSLAGPDAVYVSSIMYDGQPYSALLKYNGGTSATVQYVFGPVGKLIPDSVDLSQTTVAFESSDSFTVSNVGVSGVGYSGTLQYTGNGQLQISGISSVTLPKSPEELLADSERQLGMTETELAATKQQLDDANAMAEAATAALSAANNALAAANDELVAANGQLAAANTAKAAAQDRMEMLETELSSLAMGSTLPGLNPSLLDLESASLTPAGPNEIYISGIQYAGANVSARIRYDAGTATAMALFEGPNLVGDSLQMDAAQARVEDDSLVVTNVGIEGRAHTLTLTRAADGSVSVSASEDGWEVRTRGELTRDNLIRAGNFVVNGFAGGQALPGEGSWNAKGGSVEQTDAGATHAKFSIVADQSAPELLFGFSAKADGGKKVGFGLHVLASATPESGNTWNYGESYLLWVTQDPFYDSEDLHLQFYESADDNTLMWLASSRIPHGLDSMINVEALYRDTGMTTLLVNGEEQLTVNVGRGISDGDAIALRTLGGPVEFTQVYVAAPTE